MMDKGKFLSLFCGALFDKQFAYMKLFESACHYFFKHVPSAPAL